MKMGDLTENDIFWDLFLICLRLKSLDKTLTTRVTGSPTSSSEDDFSTREP